MYSMYAARGDPEYELLMERITSNPEYVASSVQDGLKKVEESRYVYHGFDGIVSGYLR